VWGDKKRGKSGGAINLAREKDVGGQPWFHRRGGRKDWGKGEGERERGKTR